MNRSQSIHLLLLLALIFQITQATAQVIVLEETFEDRDLTANPTWTGDLEDFSFVEENGNTLLRLNTEPDPSRTQITTLSSTTTGSWEFYFRQEFSPSNLNRAFIFLMADQDNLNYLDGSSVNGYALRTGDNQSPRRLKLVRFDNGNQTVLTEAETELSEGFGYRVKVLRTEDGNWRLFISEGYESEPIEDALPVTDLVHTESSYFGLLLRYSSGNTNRFYFDDFIIKNFDPFKLMNVVVINADQIILRFNYPLDPQSVTPQSVNFTGLPDPVTAKIDPSGNQALFTFSDMIEDGDYSVEVNSIRSEFGDQLMENTMRDFSFENPFYVIKSEIKASHLIQIRFSEAIASTSLEPINFIINGSIYPDQVQLNSSNSVDLVFSSDLPTGAVSIELLNIVSIDGWRIPDDTKLTTYRFGDAEPGSLVINEILYRRAAAGEPEFVEIFNKTDQTFNLDGWRIDTDRGGATLPAGTIISENNYLVFTDNIFFSSLDARIVHLPGFQSLRNTGDAVVLRNSNGFVIDSLYYLPHWGGNQPGVSLERKDPTALSIDPVNWEGSMDESGSTPLLQNSRYEPDIFPPVLEFALYQDDVQQVLVRFNEFVLKLPETRFSINGLNYNAELLHNRPGSELLITAEPLSSDREYFLEVEQISDHQGNVSSTLRIPVARPPESGDLVFNEIMFDPLQDDHDDLPNQTEYLEIANRRNYAVSLEGVHIHDRPDETGSVNSMYAVTSNSKWIPAGGYSLLQAENSQQEFINSGNARFFGLSEDLTPHVLRFNRASLSLPMTGREIYLVDSLQRIIDWVDYRPEWHNPNLIDTKGISLERISTIGDSNDPKNWGSNSLAIGGTPGSENSIHQIPAGTKSTNSILLEPNPFSPDGDGHEDNLFINYSFDEPDFILRVRIFDRYGRLVRNLTDSYTAGFEGSLIWDGRMDNGLTGRIGIYIVHIEAVNSSTGNRLRFKETAVLARQF